MSVDKLVEAKDLFARLSIGDLKEVNLDKIKYDFGTIIRKILGLE